VSDYACWAVWVLLVVAVVGVGFFLGNAAPHPLPVLVVYIVLLLWLLSHI
jgi:hypothetical protein